MAGRWRWRRCGSRRAAAYLWTLPLLAAGILLLLAPPASDARAPHHVDVVLAVTATLWLRDTVELLRFMVAVFGRLPIVTPVPVYAGADRRWRA